MKVILIKEVKKLGKVGDIVEISDGYARNFLFPRGLAKEASEGNVKELKKRKSAEEKKKNKEIKEAKALADKINSFTIKLKTKGGEKGRLFGSITSKDISDALKAQYGIEIDKKKINLSSPIKQTGEVIVEVKIYPEITANLKVDVSI